MLIGDWDKKGPATCFGEDQYFSTLKNCLLMENIVARHAVIMNKHDPAKRMALLVDEWCLWTDVELRWSS